MVVAGLCARKHRQIATLSPEYSRAGFGPPAAGRQKKTKQPRRSKCRKFFNPRSLRLGMKRDRGPTRIDGPPEREKLTARQPREGDRSKMRAGSRRAILPRRPGRWRRPNDVDSDDLPVRRRALPSRPPVAMTSKPRMDVGRDLQPARIVVYPRCTCVATVPSPNEREATLSQAGCRQTRSRRFRRRAPAGKTAKNLGRPASRIAIHSPPSSA